MRHLLLTTLLFTQILFADLKVGDTFPAITLPDQFDKEVTVGPDDQIVMMSFEKGVSVGINEYLKTKPGTFLDRHHCKYISDISSMPSFITKMFVLPKMKDYPFELMLIYDDTGEQFAREEEKITVYSIDHGVISSIRFITDKELPALFGDE